MPINYNLLRLEIDKQAGAICAKAKPLIQQEFDEKKAAMLEEFDKHEVTQQLAAGPNSTSAEVNAATDGHGGNLYSLLGFEAGEDPVGATREVLDKGIRLNISQTKREVRPNVIEFKTPVIVPTLDDVHSKVAKSAPLEWGGGRSFTEMLERGITGFNRYLFKGKPTKGSRSGPAIQTKEDAAPVRSGSFGKVRYVSDIIAGFRKSILGK